MKVKLTRQEMHECQVLGQDTVKICKMQKLTPRLETSDESRVLSNVQGFRAEYAVSKVFGCTLPSFNIVTDGGVDLWLEDRSIDVKLTKKHDGDLIFDDFTKFKSDLAVLVATTDDASVYEILGWIDRDGFEAGAEDRDYGYGSRKVIESKDLYPIQNLWLEVVDSRFGPH